MAKQTISIGTTANDGTGSTIRAGGDIINDNFDEIYAAFGDGSTLTSGFISGKTEGANFSSSLLVGHSTTGTLNNATENVGVGKNSLYAITSGDNNTAVGFNSLSTLTSESDNTAIGNEAGKVVSSDKNTLIGASAGLTVSSGNTNTFIGYNAGADITTEKGNIIIGQAAGAVATDYQFIVASQASGDSIVTWLSGDSTGKIVVAADPTVNLGIATKQYVDNKVATSSAGLVVHESVEVATTANITATYANGTAGVGATLTFGSAVTSIDDIALTNGDRILVKDQTTALQNGIYTRTSTTVWTRATDYDEAADVQAGDFVYVISGTANAETSFVQNTVMVTMGTTSITWQTFAIAGTGTIATQDSNNVNITGGTITLGTLANTQSLLIKDSTGATLKTIYGTTS